MKKFMELAVQFKFVWGLINTAAIILYSTVSMLLGKTSMEFIVVWQFAVITFVLVFVHFLIFGEYILSSLMMKYKLIIHFVLCYIISLVSTIILKWVDFSNLHSVAIFSGAYTLIYLAVCFSLYMYYKGTGEKLNDKLASYKRKKKEDY